MQRVVFLLAGVVWMMQECACTQQRAPFAAQRSYLSTFAGSRRCASLCSMGCAWWLGGWCGCSLLTLCCSQLRIRFVVAAGRHGVGLGGWDDTTLLEASLCIFPFAAQRSSFFDVCWQPKDDLELCVLCRLLKDRAGETKCRAAFAAQRSYCSTFAGSRWCASAGIVPCGLRSRAQCSQASREDRHRFVRA